MNASMASLRLPRSIWIMPIIELAHAVALRVARGDLELADRVVEEAHLLVGDAEVVVALRVVDADLLRRRPP